MRAIFVRSWFVRALFAIAILPSGIAAAQSPAPREAVIPAEWTNAGAVVSVREETGKIRFLGTAPGRPLGNAAAREASALARRITASEAARGFLARHGSLFGLRNQSDELRLRSENAAGAGRTVLRFQQVLRGVPVVGGELFVQLNQDQDILSVNGEVLPDVDVATAPLVERAAAQSLAREAVAKRYRIDAVNLRASEPELWIYRPSLIGPGVDVTALVWRMDVMPVDLLPIRELVLIDAARGSLALRFNQVPTSRNRETYTADNGTFLPGILLCDEGDSSCGDSHADAAHRYAADSYDFYSANHGRDSLDDAGATIQSTVHYDFDYFNAFWDGDQLVYGDGCSFPLADDVVAHEFTHGVTDHESALFYYYESGAINESLSDIWGEFVDLTNGGNDTAAVRWLIGENLSGPGCGPIRNMKTPGAFGDPDKMTSPNFYKGSEDDGGVHINSGVNNKAAFLLTDGGTFNGKTVTGLGILKVSKIYYEAQTNLLVSGSDYADLYDALNQACSNLVGTAGITPADCQEVRAAADAVEMTKLPAGFSSDAPLCTGVGQHVDLFSDNLDDSEGANFDAVGPLSAWSMESFYASDGTQHLFGDDSFTNANESAEMNLDVALPGGSAPYLRFEHAFGFEEPNFDGGVLEYSTNNGATWSDAGTLFDHKGYTSTIRLGTGNPLQGRKAFVADSRGYVSSRVKLASLAGQSVRFRWRLGTDGSVSDRGWFVDGVRIYTCSGGVLQFGTGFSKGEAGPAATVTVTRTGSTDGTVSVSYATSDGTADALDYTATSGVLTFPSGVASRSFSVPINNDNIDEANETIHLTLSSPTNFATLGSRDTAELTIIDNDSAGTLQLNASYSVDEAAGTASIAVTRSGGSSGGIEVSYSTTDGSAMSGSDYTAASGTLSFAAGELNKSFLVTILDDGIAEGDESFNVHLSNPTGGAVLGARKSAPVNVFDDEIGVLFDAANFIVSEAGPAATIRVKREGPTAGTVGVSYAASDGTATEGLDYGTTAGTLSLGPGVLSQTFVVPILNDAIVEGSEVLMLRLFSPTGGALLGRYNTAVLTVTDNDPPVLLKFSGASYSASESKPFATITVSRVGSTAGTVGVNYATSDGTATLAGNDYTAASGTLSFAPGVKSQSFTVPITNDTADETNETVSLLLSSPSGGALLGAPFASVLNVLDNDAGGTLQLNLAAYNGNETSGAVMVTVTRSMGSAGGVSVSYATSDGSATAGSDYTATSGILNFGAGEPSKSFTVPILDDAEGEGKETLDIILSAPSGGAVLGPRKKSPLTIVDDDSVSGGTLQLNLAAYKTSEAAGTQTVSVTRSGGAASAVSVDYATTDGSATAGSDYTSTSGTLNFGVNERMKSFVIPILDDASAEGTESLGITLSNPTGGALLGRSTAPVSIVDSEAALQFSMANFSAGEKGAATILVTRTGSSQSTVGVSYAATGGTAAAGSDFTAVSGTLTFGPGLVSRSFTVPIASDTLDESNETVNLALSSPTGGIVVGAQGTAVLSITDNDAAGSLQFKSAVFSASETSALVTITITRTGGTASGVSVDYASGGGSATPGSDYTAVTGTVSFGAGILTRTFTVSVTNDTLDEVTEELILTLSNPQGGASLGAQSSSMVNIADNDVAGKAQFKIGVQSVSEADSSVSIVVTRSGGVASAATVDFATSNGSATAGSDYTAASGTLTFDVSETTKTLSISLQDDASDEGNETINLTLSNPGGGLLLGVPSTAVLFIVDNE